MTDSASEAAPALTADTVSSTKGGILLTVMGQGVTNEQHALPAGSFSIAAAHKGTDGACTPTLTLTLPQSITTTARWFRPSSSTRWHGTRAPRS